MSARIPSCIAAFLALSTAAHAVGIDEAKLTASDLGLNAYFGTSVAISGNIAIIGANGDSEGGSSSGAAYLFDVTTGAQIAKLTASNPQENAYFGTSVAISGDIAIVGANGESGGGAAYLFDVTTGSQIARITGSNTGQSDEFGYAVGISGDVAVVGAFRVLSASGRAYLFDATTGAQTSVFYSGQWDAPGFSFQTYSRTGESVGISGDIVVLGASGQERLLDGEWKKSGAVHVFDTGAGAHRMLYSTDGAEEDYFGKSVAISGDTVIVGAPDADGAGTGSGAAYLFDATTGAQIAKLIASDGAINEFGISVAISGNLAVVGARSDNGGALGSGAAYLFDVSTGEEIAKLTASDPGRFAFYGNAVAVSDGAVLVGAYWDDAGEANSGAAYLYTPLPGAGWLLLGGLGALGLRTRNGARRGAGRA